MVTVLPKYHQTKFCVEEKLRQQDNKEAWRRRWRHSVPTSRGDWVTLSTCAAVEGGWPNAPSCQESPGDCKEQSRGSGQNSGKKTLVCHPRFTVELWSYPYYTCILEGGNTISTALWTTRGCYVHNRSSSHSNQKKQATALETPWNDLTYTGERNVFQFSRSFKEKGAVPCSSTNPFACSSRPNILKKVYRVILLWFNLWNGRHMDMYDLYESAQPNLWVLNVPVVHFSNMPLTEIWAFNLIQQTFSLICNQ